jgi:HPt (histidine-containing phosphotransfer) domain-containing protein
MAVAVEHACPLDVDDGLARAGEEMEFYRELLDLFMEDVPPRVEEVRQAVTARDAARLSSAAHAIKGAAANLSAVPLRDCAFRMEMRGREGNLEGVDELLRELEDELLRLAEFIRTF